ncbi:unnamed protein product, partial [Mesorhabditis spiculigera]
MDVTIQGTPVEYSTFTNNNNNNGGSFDASEFARKFRDQFLSGPRNGFGGMSNANNYNNNNQMPPAFSSQPNKGKCPYCFGNNFKKAKRRV